ncbi:aminotransferase class V-fold PLP-dependent enzyme [Lapillicoccus sp.]|uniref:aminotransferase class V-fold PLP-dependent enzyme n=1 Tax=Lapillicoccus sp. TaxID=1909287 RepID=UPI003265972D
MSVASIESGTTTSTPFTTSTTATSRTSTAPQGRLHVVRPGSAPELPAVVGAGLRVPTLTGEVDYANLDHAASTPSLVCVKNAVDTALQTYSSVHRGNGYASRVTSAWYEQARDEVAAFVGARADDHVIFTRNTTDSFNLLAKVLPSGTEVFVFETEHHSTLLPWRGHPVTTLPVPSSVDAGLEELGQALAHSGARHRLVVVAGASNVTGETWPLGRVVALARRYRARVALDAAQLAPHRAIDIAASGVDYVAFSGHKLYAPFGAGVLAGRADWLDHGAPYLRGGGATSRVTTNGATWATGPARHEGGSPNVIGAIALAAACSAISGSRPSIEAYEEALYARLCDGLDAIPGADTWSIFGDSSESAAAAAGDGKRDTYPDRVAVLPFTIDRFDSSLVSAILSAEYGIGVRHGKFCAHILVDELLEDPWGEVPATAVRVSLGLASTPEHVDRLVAAVATLAAHGPSRRYVRTEQGWVADDDTREALPARPW